MFRRIRRKEHRRAVGTHYGPTRRHQAGYSQRHRRDGRADTTILYHPRIHRWTQALLNDDYGPAGGCWNMGNAAAPAGAVGLFTGLRAGREQRTPTLTPPRPQYLPRDYGPDGDADGLCRSTQRHADDSTTRPSGSGPMSQSDERDLELSSICQGPTRP